MSLTQQQIVAKLGISRGTLHRVLIDSPLVKSSTRERVLKELEKLNYVPNIIAQGLKTHRTKTIGIIGPASIKIANIDKINAIHLAARRRGYTAIIGYSNGTSEEDAACVRELRSRMVDGFVAIGRGFGDSVPLYRSLLEAGIPLVTLYPVDGLKADCVHVDTRKAFETLTAHLIGLGHTKIGLLIDASASLYTVNRERGFRAAMKKARLPVNEEWIIRITPDGALESGDPGATGSWQASDYQLGFWGASLLLAKRERPTALVSFSDEFAIGVLRACDLAGVSVPSDLALTGYDDKEPAKFARVPLTTMHQPDDRVGEEAVTLLLKRIEEKEVPSSPVTVAMEARLVVRSSCGAR